MPAPLKAEGVQNLLAALVPIKPDPIKTAFVKDQKVAEDVLNAKKAVLIKENLSVLPVNQPVEVFPNHAAMETDLSVSNGKPAVQKEEILNVLPAEIFLHHSVAAINPKEQNEKAIIRKEEILNVLPVDHRAEVFLHQPATEIVRNEINVMVKDVRGEVLIALPTNPPVVLI